MLRDHKKQPWHRLKATGRFGVLEEFDLKEAKLIITDRLDVRMLLIWILVHASVRKAHNLALSYYFSAQSLHLIKCSNIMNKKAFLTNKTGSSWQWQHEKHDLFFCFFFPSGALLCDDPLQRLPVFPEAFNRTWHDDTCDISFFIFFPLVFATAWGFSEDPCHYGMETYTH